MHTKGQLIDRIRELNPTVSAQFLQQFDEEELTLYLRRLEEVRDNRLRISGWRPPSGRRAAS